MQSGLGRSSANLLAGSDELHASGLDDSPYSPGNPHHTYRLLRRAATRPGDPGDGDRGLDAEPLCHPQGHGSSDRLADGAVLLQQFLGDTQRLNLYGVVVGDNSSDKDIGAARDLSEPTTQQTAGAGLRHRQPQ